MSKLLKILTQFYKLPYENIMENTTHQEFIEMSIDDMIVFASLPEVKNGADLDWLFMNIIRLEEEELEKEED
jgi:hypothetical protein